MDDMSNNKVAKVNHINKSYTQNGNFSKDLIKKDNSKYCVDIKLLEYHLKEQESILCDMYGIILTSNSTFKRYYETSHFEHCNYPCNHWQKTFKRLDNIRRYITTVHNTIPGPEI